jgi:hypothetical protein
MPELAAHLGAQRFDLRVIRSLSQRVRAARVHHTERERGNGGGSYRRHEDEAAGHHWNSKFGS